MQDSLQLASLASWGRGWLVSLHLSQGPSSVTACQGMGSGKLLSGKERKEHSARTMHKKSGCRTEGTSLQRAADCHASAANVLLGRGPLRHPCLQAGQDPSIVGCILGQWPPNFRIKGTKKNVLQIEQRKPDTGLC